jgi:hypothetical protein
MLSFALFKAFAIKKEKSNRGFSLSEKLFAPKKFCRRNAPSELKDLVYLLD